MTSHGHLDLSETGNASPFFGGDESMSEDGGALVIRLSERYKLSQGDTISFIAEVQESFGGDESSSGTAAHLLRMVKRGLREVLRSRTLRELSDKLRYFCMAMHWYDLLDGIDNATDLGKALKVTKANANKFVCMFRDIIPDGMNSLPPSGGQRKDFARAKFARKRKEQESQRK